MEVLTHLQYKLTLAHHQALQHRSSVHSAFLWSLFREAFTMIPEHTGSYNQTHRLKSAFAFALLVGCVLQGHSRELELLGGVSLPEIKEEGNLGGVQPS